MSLKQTRAAIPFVIIDNTHHEFSASPTSNDTIVGTTRFFDLSEQHKHLEIGFTWYNPAVWRTSVNTEIKFMLLKFAFETLQCIRVQLKTDARNTRSQTAIERLGAVREGMIRKMMILPNGHERNVVIYGITNDEWYGTVKNNLLNKLNLPPVVVEKQ